MYTHVVYSAKRKGLGGARQGPKDPFRVLWSMLATKNKSMGPPAYSWEIAPIKEPRKHEESESNIITGKREKIEKKQSFIRNVT